MLKGSHGERNGGQPAAAGGRITIEVMYKADYCLPCYFMDQAVQEVLPRYGDRVAYRRVDFMNGEGRRRFLELSVSLFGEEGVFRKLRVAPVPSLFIDGELFFDAIPPRFELEAAIEEALGGTPSTSDRAGGA